MICFLLDHVDVLGWRFQARGNGDADCGLYLVPGDHPHTDSSVSQGLEGIHNVFLKFVLDTSDAQQVHSLLQGFDHFFDCWVTSNHESGGIEEFLVPRLESLFTQVLLGKNQCPQTISREVFTLIEDKCPQCLWNLLLHHSICPLQVEHHSVCLFVAQDDPHPLGLRSEGEDGLDLVLLLLLFRVQYGDSCSSSIDEAYVQPLCDLYQGNLIRATRLVHLLSIFNTGSHVVTQSQAIHEVSNNEMLLPLNVLQLLPLKGGSLDLLLDVSHGSNGLRVSLFNYLCQQWLLMLLKAPYLTYGNLLEDHFVLCECSCLVTEDVVHPAQLLRNLTIPGDSPLDLWIVVDLVGKDDLRQIQIHPQTDRDDTRQQQDLSEYVQQPVLSEPTCDYDQNGQNAHEDEQDLREVVELLVSTTYLVLRVPGVHHAPHLPASIDHNSNGFSVGQVAISPQSVVKVEAFSTLFILLLEVHALALNLEDTLEVVNVQFGSLSVHNRCQGEQVVPIGVELVGESDGSSQLPICLPIQLVCPDENSTIWVIRGQNYNICGYPLVALYLDDVTNTHVHSHDLLLSTLPEDSVPLSVGLKIPGLPVPVVVGLLQKRESQHQYQRCNVGEHEPHLQHVDKLAHGDEQEEEVEEVLELVVKDEGQEGLPSVA